MSDLIPYGRSGGSLSRRDARTVGREMARLSAQTGLQLASIEQTAVVQAARVDAVAYVGRAAMREATMLTQIETELATLAPGAAGRLQAIADLTALAMIEVVTDTGKRVR